MLWFIRWEDGGEGNDWDYVESVIYFICMESPNYKKSEELALEVLRENKIDRPFVDVFSIVRHSGLGIRFVSFESEFVNVAGFFDPETKSIFVNNEQSTNRQTFTVAHELGHYLLGHKPDQYGVLMRWPKGEKSLIEKEADVFAANLLVPKSMLLTVKKKYILSDDDVDILAKIFAVSREMMTYRLRWLRMN